MDIDDLSPQEYADRLNELVDNFGSFEDWLDRAIERHPDYDWSDAHNPYFEALVRADEDNWSHAYHGSLHALFVEIGIDDWEDSEGYFDRE